MYILKFLQVKQTKTQTKTKNDFDRYRNASDTVGSAPDHYNKASHTIFFGFPVYINYAKQ